MGEDFDVCRGCRASVVSCYRGVQCEDCYEIRCDDCSKCWSCEPSCYYCDIMVIVPNLDNKQTIEDIKKLIENKCYCNNIRTKKDESETDETETDE
jgi:hypothetical protein